MQCKKHNNHVLNEHVYIKTCVQTYAGKTPHTMNPNQMFTVFALCDLEL